MNNCSHILKCVGCLAEKNFTSWVGFRDEIRIFLNDGTYQGSEGVDDLSYLAVAPCLSDIFT
jgi:hypothetical protein